MPVLAGATPSPPPPPPPPPTPPPAPPAEPEAVEATWYAPDGTVWPLLRRELGWWTPAAIRGLDAAPIALTFDRRQRGGATVRHVQPLERLITWPLRVEGSTHVEFLGRWRALARAFTCTRRLGSGTLVITRPDGSAREIQAWYQSGFDGNPGEGWRWNAAVMTLVCEDPYWRDRSATVIEREAGAGVDFLAPFPTVSSSQLLGATTLHNPGDAEAWPDWVITGPMTSLVATNSSTGEAFTLTATLTAGQTATITTEPPTVRGPAGQVWTDKLTWPGAVLWGLIPGDNAVMFAVGGAAAGTRIRLSFRARYETA